MNAAVIDGGRPRWQQSRDPEVGDHDLLGGAQATLATVDEAHALAGPIDLSWPEAVCAFP